MIGIFEDGRYNQAHPKQMPIQPLHPAPPIHMGRGDDHLEDIPMPKPTPPANADDPAQSQRFIDMAREIEADETSEALDRALEKVIAIPPDKS